MGDRTPDYFVCQAILELATDMTAKAQIQAILATQIPCHPPLQLRPDDGWLPSLGPETGIQEVLSRIHHQMIAINRDPLSLGIEGLVQLSEIHPDGPGG